MAAVLPLDPARYARPPSDAGCRASVSPAPEWRAAPVRRLPAAAAHCRVPRLGPRADGGACGRGARGSSLASTERLPHVRTVVVQPGDSLWSLAHRLAPDADPRSVVDVLVDARGTADVTPGETLTWLG